MKKTLKFFLLVFFIILTQVVFNAAECRAQTIRKNWREMTTHEKDVYISALRALYQKTPNLIETYVSTHANGTYVRHQQLDFLLWHRMFIYYFEKELINSGVANASNISLPYWGWDTSGDWSPSSTLFSNGSNNLGLFGYAIPEGTFSRAFGQPFSQPTSSELQNLSTSYAQFGSDYGSQQSTNFWPRLEAVYHNNYHVFVGGSTGTMTNITISPRDPVFYQHHCYVDKIWQDWHNANGSSSIANQNVLINTIPGQPQILRSGTVDSRLLKVWYASNGQVVLDKYTVTNTEHYRYTGVFTIGNSSNPVTNAFIIPSGTTCNVVSGTSISLMPGFSATNGSAFSATIDLVSSPTSIFNAGRLDNAIAMATERQAELFTSDKFKVFPNPSTGGRFTVALLTNEDINYEYTIYDAIGKPVLIKNSISSDKEFEIDLSEKPLGIYLIHLKMKEGKSYLKKIISN